MLSETVVAFFLLVWLVVFSAVNLHNILRTQKRRSRVRAYAEVERPSGFVMVLGAAGTIIYFLAILLFLFLVFVGSGSLLGSFPFDHWFSLVPLTQVLSLVLTSSGYLLFISSVIVRGKYAVSWEMPEHQELVTWGPYRYVRHPSYLGYFLMFIGLFFLWANVITFVPLLAIPAYYQLTFEEERLLTARFGKEYRQYQTRTGRLFPKFG